MARSSDNSMQAGTGRMITGRDHHSFAGISELATGRRGAAGRTGWRSEIKPEAKAEAAQKAEAALAE